MEVVAVLGASKDPSRYSYMAVEMLRDKGHSVIPVNPRESEILGLKVMNELSGLIGKKIDTITVYVNSVISSNYEADFLKIKPNRVIFNPGAENPKLAEILKKNQIKVEEACTLVLLRTSQF